MGTYLAGRRVPAAELAAVDADPDTAPELFAGVSTDPEVVRRQFDVEKAWHGIHFLLTGSAWDVTDGAGAAVLGGTPTGPEAFYEAVRLHRPDEVRAIAAALAALDRDDLVGRFDPAAMAALDIYPGIWDREYALAMLLAGVETLRHAYATAAEHGEAVALVLM